MSETSKCASSITVSSLSKWSDRLGTQVFFIITSNLTITEQDYEKAVQTKSLVLEVSEDDFRTKVVPYSETRNGLFRVDCLRTRNCDVVNSPRLLYVTSLIVPTSCCATILG
ncbi:MAG: hypothetical protein P4M11_12055 [Candidatus Pacebacteria bacterium]|nr:hypothetical protein [Candidatus Paceibacterota bacterium]